MSVLFHWVSPKKWVLDEILGASPQRSRVRSHRKEESALPDAFDSEGKVLSFPPIINSNDLGKITEESRNLLVEVTGTLHKTVLNTLNLGYFGVD